MKVVAILLSILSIVYLSSIRKEKESSCGNLNFHNLLKPIPKTAKFINDTSFIWGGSLVKSHIDKKYYLFYSRWPREFGMNAWVTHSEVARAVSESPFGPFEFRGATLPVRGAGYWDGLSTHNPTVHFFDGKYYLYYTGNTGDGKVTSPKLNWSHRNNQRIGLAVAVNPDGPWERFDRPIIDVNPDSTAYDALMISNPSVTLMPDGRYLMVYKAVAKKRSMPFGGPVVHLTAIADSPEGPFVKHNNPIFTNGNDDFPAEDPFVWFDGKCYYAIVKDMRGSFTDAGRSLVLFHSTNGLDWNLAKNPLVSTLNIYWDDSTFQKLEALERPQIFFRNGKMIALLAAVKVTRDHSFNVQIPLE